MRVHCGGEEGSQVMMLSQTTRCGGGRGGTISPTCCSFNSEETNGRRSKLRTAARLGFWVSSENAILLQHLFHLLLDDPTRRIAHLTLGITYITVGEIWKGLDQIEQSAVGEGLRDSAAALILTQIDKSEG